ncbi:hypothetical protein Bbelb_059340 [Branchiostoma belcheri]|nr:hypothetical protein Bbelb_059340 [Branchiostoma belcheri]
MPPAAGSSKFNPSAVGPEMFCPSWHVFAIYPRRAIVGGELKPRVGNISPQLSGTLYLRTCPPRDPELTWRWLGKKSSPRARRSPRTAVYLSFFSPCNSTRQVCGSLTTDNRRTAAQSGALITQPCLSQVRERIALGVTDARSAMTVVHCQLH